MTDQKIYEMAQHIEQVLRKSDRYEEPVTADVEHDRQKIVRTYKSLDMNHPMGECARVARQSWLESYLREKLQTPSWRRH